MSGPSSMPHPAEPCVLGAGLFVASWLVAGVLAFLIGSAVARRVWP